MRPHGISHCSFLVYLSGLRIRVTVAFWTLLPVASLSACCAFVPASCSSGYDFAIPSSRLFLTKQTLGVAFEFVGNYASVDFHHRALTCPSYQKTVTVSPGTVTRGSKAQSRQKKGDGFSWNRHPGQRSPIPATRQKRLTYTSQELPLAIEIYTLGDGSRRNRPPFFHITRQQPESVRVCPAAKQGHRELTSIPSGDGYPGTVTRGGMSAPEITSAYLKSKITERKAKSP